MKTESCKNKQCDGWRRYGGAFTLGPPKWEQCTNEATVELEIVQDGKKSEMAACNLCWEEACNTPSITIKSALPLGLGHKETK